MAPFGPTAQPGVAAKLAAFKDPVTLPTGEQGKFLEDGDEIILRGWCERDGFRRIGLGSCRGVILPASVT